MSAGLYIHIPFCAQKCKYCDFVSFPAVQQTRTAYLRALEKEMLLRAREGVYGDFDTVFVGGGTPSLLTAAEMDAVFCALRRHFSLAPGAEITLEANPGTLDTEKLRAYRDMGVNRLSIGLQSADASLLQRIGRIHTYEAFVRSFEAAQKTGFSNSNVDIMYGLPGQTMEAHGDTLRRVCALAPAHISAYSLILEEGTPLFAENPALPDEDAAYAMHLFTREYLAEKGYARYEISNYARAGMACRHNLHYWNMDAYLGLGLGAHSAWRMDGVWTRFCNTADMGAYLRALEADTLAQEESTPVPPREEMFEYMMLGLRKAAGIDEADFTARFRQTPAEVYGKALQTLRKRGYLEPYAGGCLRLSERGLDMQNEALLCFMDV